MPSGSRIRGNNVFGLVADLPLSSASVTMNSAGLANLPVIGATQHAIITLDPLRVNGAPEIVVATSHTSLATVVTIIRGAYGTVPRAHPQGTLWTHTPVNEDYISVLTSATRPLDPYKGEFIFESDTNKLVGYGGVDWAPRDAGGQLNYAQNITSQNTFTTVETDITNLAVLVTVGTGRRIKITGQGQFTDSVASDEIEFKIKEGATVLQTANVRMSTGVGNISTGLCSITLTPTAGAHTYKLAAVRTTGSGTVTNFGSATGISYILVEDVGAA